jgi:branched-chain amino acid transport system ATP-binding protein
MLEIRKLSTGYETGDVLHGIDLRVGLGEIVALVGANGAGKSTLVKTVSGLVPARVGEILFEGRRIDRMKPRERVLLGIAHVPEGRQIFPGLTVAENLELGAYSHGALDQKIIRQRIHKVCAPFPILLERLSEPVSNLSGGQQQMLAIARGLMAEPRLIMLDEPSLGLAPALVVEIFRMIASMRELGLAILLSEQNARSSLAISDRAYVIEQGSVALEGSGKELLGMSEVAERYLGVGKSVGRLDEQRHQHLVGRLKTIFGAAS